ATTIAEPRALRIRFVGATRTRALASLLDVELHASGEPLPEVPASDEEHVEHDHAERVEVPDDDAADPVIGRVGVHRARRDPRDEAEEEHADGGPPDAEEPAHRSAIFVRLLAVALAHRIGAWGRGAHSSNRLVSWRARSRARRPRRTRASRPAGALARAGAACLRVAPPRVPVPVARESAPRVGRPAASARPARSWCGR